MSIHTSTATSASQEIVASLRQLGLITADQHPSMVALSGGVSSDIWRVDLASGPVCVKRSLPRLKVEALWEAPVARNAYECAWIETVAKIYPQAVPKIIAHDRQAGLFVMQYLDPTHYPVWKERLHAGEARASFAARVGTTLAGIHGATANNQRLAQRFATDDIFYALRLESYLVATARRYADLASALQALVRTTAQTKRVLVHGDVSPKNILIGPQGPVFLDAECAWYGDPAFDLAFCVNHFLLKCLWTPRAARDFLTCFTAMVSAYRAAVTWEPKEALERRTARLLPGLLLARVDGKSPVEYLTQERDKDRVRRVATKCLNDPPARLEQVRVAWAKEIGL
jgi:aminoglycoside phosphotransferase (APT) family kinase protein